MNYLYFLVYICEDARANLYSCEDYPGIINILNVDFPEENEDYCGNNNVQKNNTCLASEDDERNLTSVLRKKCNGKRDCKIHLSHGVYKGMHLPCRDLNIRIRIGIFYDCRYCKFICILSLYIVYAFKLTPR